MEIEYYIAIIYLVSCLLFSYITNWYVYDYKKIKEETEIYTMSDFIGWLTPFWPIVIAMLIINKFRYGKSTRNKES